MIYVVSRSDHYYPCSGAEDWELVTRNRDDAIARARGIAEDLRYQSVVVIAINEDNLHVSYDPEFPYD